MKKEQYSIFHCLSLEIISKLGHFPFQNLCVIIFKNNPESVLIEQLKTDGFDIYELPENPYV